MRLVLFLAVLASLFVAQVSLSHAQQTSGICATVNNALEGLAKDDAYIWAGGIGDNSAPRETNRQLELLNNAIERNSMIQIAVANRCPMTQLPPDRVLYSIPAMNCMTERLRQPASSNLVQCDRSTWERGGASAN